jgi:hypothetical protein
VQRYGFKKTLRIFFDFFNEILIRRLIGKLSAGCINVAAAAFSYNANNTCVFKLTDIVFLCLFVALVVFSVSNGIVLN